MKKTCKGCVAEGLGGKFFRCELGYKTEVTGTFQGIVISQKPLEECEKPRSNKALSTIYRIKQGKIVAL